MCVCVCVSVGVYVCAPEYRFPWRLRDEVFQVLEFLAVGCCLIGVLSNRLESSTKLVPDINHWTSPHPYTLNHGRGRKTVFLSALLCFCVTAITLKYDHSKDMLAFYITVIQLQLLTGPSSGRATNKGVMEVFYMFAHTHIYICMLYMCMYTCVHACIFFLRDLGKFCINILAWSQNFILLYFFHFSMRNFKFMKSY